MRHPDRLRPRHEHEAVQVGERAQGGADLLAGRVQVGGEVRDRGAAASSRNDA